jgi:hypothetical protein
MERAQGHVTISAAGLEGVPADVLAGYTKRAAEDGSGDVYDISFRTVDMIPIVRLCLSVSHHDL